MPISSRLLSKAHNRCVVMPAWAPINDWLTALAENPLATPLIDFGANTPIMRVGVTGLNWFLMDLLGLRGKWYVEGWHSRDEIWLLINPMRYRLLGHQPRRPYAEDVRDYLKRCCPEILHYSLGEHRYFAVAPTINRYEFSDADAEAVAAAAPWSRAAVVDFAYHIIGMVWAPGPLAGGLPPILKPYPSSRGSASKGYS
jgi:hypothetical protein